MVRTPFLFPGIDTSLSPTLSVSLKYRVLPAIEECYNNPSCDLREIHELLRSNAEKSDVHSAPQVRQKRLIPDLHTDREGNNELKRKIRHGYAKSRRRGGEYAREGFCLADSATARCR